MNVERPSITCIRYMPTLRVPVSGSFVITAGRVMNGAGSPGQQVWIGQPRDVDLVAREHDLLAFALRDDLRRRVGDRLELLQAAHLLPEPLRRLHLEHVGELLRDSVEARRPEREAHAPLGAELVDEERVLGALRVLEEQRRAAARLDEAVDDLGDLEVRVDLGRDAVQLALALEERDPVAEVAKGATARVPPRGAQSISVSAYSTASSSVSARPWDQRRANSSGPRSVRSDRPSLVEATLMLRLENDPTSLVRRLDRRE